MGWGFSSVVEHLSSKCKVLGSFLSSYSQSNNYEWEEKIRHKIIITQYSPDTLRASLEKR